MSHSSFDFDYRGKPPALTITPMTAIPPHGTNYFRQRAIEINADIAREQGRRQALRNVLAGAAMVGVCALCGLAGFVLASDRYDGSTYDLVQTHATGESDIIDYDLSADDCRGYLLAGGRNLTCEKGN